MEELRKLSRGYLEAARKWTEKHMRHSDKQEESRTLLVDCYRCNYERRVTRADWGECPKCSSTAFWNPDVPKELRMRHSDNKEEFETGAWRDSDKGKGRPSLISPVLIHRLGVLLQKGVEEGGHKADNWMKGMPYRRTADSMVRHIFKWLAGADEEDHLAAVCFGAMCLMTYESNSDLDPALDDRDPDLKKILPAILTLASVKATLETDDEEPCNCSWCSEWRRRRRMGQWSLRRGKHGEVYCGPG